MEIEVYNNKDGKLIYKGIYEFLEGGIEEDGTPSFHIDAHSPNFQQEFSIYFKCKNKIEVEEFIEDLKEQVLK